MNPAAKLEEPCPFEGANIFSKLVFGWTTKLFYKGTRKNLELKDLYITMNPDKSELLGNKLETHWNEELNRAHKKRSPSLLRALVKTFFWQYFIQGIYILILECGLRASAPFVLGNVISYFNNSDGEDTSRHDVIMYGCILIVINLTVAFFAHHTQLDRLRIGMQVRVACCSVLYRKVLRLNLTSLGKTSTGQVVNLISNDVNRFDLVFTYLHYVWILPLQLAIITYLLWRNVQVSSLAGVVVMAVQTVPLQGYFGKVSSRLRIKIAKLTDERVLLMSEIISGIQIIKMYAWELPFEKMVRLARASEVNVIQISSYFRGLNLSFMVFTERTTLFLTLVCYSALGHTVTPEKAFAMAQFFNILQSTMAIYYPNAISFGAETLVSIRRLQAFLLLDEKCQQQHITSQSGQVGEIKLANVNAAWVKGVPTLRNLTVHIPTGKITTIIGSVGSGKSSFLNLLLSELQLQDGSVTVNGKISYASQEPWLFQSTVRNNILFGLPYNEQKYQDVVRVCSLSKDFEQFPYGDKTVLSDQGTSLSGGQKARVNFARAVYRSSDIYLMDDPLSAVDTHVSKHLFEKCIVDYLHGKTRILVTHQIQFLKDVDHIIILNKGQVVAQGTYEELCNSKLQFTEYLHNEEEAETPINTEVPPNFESPSEVLSKRISVLSYQSSTIPYEAPIQLEDTSHDEEMESGKLSGKVYAEYFKASGNLCERILLVFILILTQLICSGNDYWLSFWTNMEARRHRYQLEDRRNQVIVEFHNESFHNKTWYTVEDGNDTETDIMHPDLLPTSTVLYVYLAFIVAVIILTIVRSIYFFRLCMSASKNLHNKMFHVLLQAPMRFYDNNPLGRILNRFSKDMGATDEILPKGIIETVQIFSVMIGIIIVVVIVNPYMLVAVAFIAIAFTVLRWIYLQCAQDIKRLEGITRSPVFSHLNASLAGLTTIRCCNTQMMIKEEFDDHQNLHSSAWYLTLVCSAALGFWVDMLCIIFVAVLIFVFIFVDTEQFTGSQVGLALSQAMILCQMVQYGIKLSADVMCNMTSVERIVQYTKVETEGPFETSPNNVLPKNWPSQGHLEFKDVSMRYALDKPNVLKHLNLNIEPGEKIGIVGRTGAGKSSFISSLFRLSFLDGDILIDDVNTTNIGLKDLRSHISIIPQQPILFTATLRYNLDPFQQYADHQLWEVLEQVELKQGTDTLDFEVHGGGSNFSLGQRQLICLARAILRNNKVLVLDEATANVDPHTDALIQKTIRKRFAECTVLTIAHRLHTIMDSDKVLVMDVGRMVEYDHPHLLLQDKSGYFYQMVQQTDGGMIKHLTSIAKENYAAKFAIEVSKDKLV